MTEILMAAQVPLAGELDTTRRNDALKRASRLLMQFQDMLAHITLVAKGARAYGAGKWSLALMHDSNVLGLVEQLAKRLVTQVAFVRLGLEVDVALVHTQGPQSGEAFLTEVTTVGSQFLVA